MKTVLFLILFFPLAGAFFHALIGRLVPRKIVETIACAGIIASFFMSVTALWMSGKNTRIITFFEWIKVDDFVVSMDVFYDPLAAIMAVTVTFVASLIHLYSIGYMKNDEGYVRYFCFMNFFVFSMLVITLADNLIFLFLGWEGVGFCSYGLIGFWYKDIRNATAGRKAFMVTRIGDVAFGVSIALFFIYLNNTSISHISINAGELSVSIATLLGALLLWSAAGKSAQLPLSVWLPDAMAGPAPVSALIHAATMVTAGVYLLMRLFPVLVLSSTTLLVIAITGTITAFLAACSALAQTDIKRVLAYSTISQVGYMTLAIGVGDITSGMHLLLSHAFYKSLLFLCAGIIIHAIQGEQNIYRMGDHLGKKLPIIFWIFLAGTLSLGAFPPFGGFFAKDQILISTFSHPGLPHKIIGILGTVTVFLTSLYSFRLFFVIFFKNHSYESYGETGRPPEKLNQGSPLMVYILGILGILSILAGFINFPSSSCQWLSHYLSNLAVIGRFEHNVLVHAFILKTVDAVFAIAGLGLAYFLFMPKKNYRDRVRQKGMEHLTKLCKSGFYLDHFYLYMVARPFGKIAGFLWKYVDETLVDGVTRKMGHVLCSLSMMLRYWGSGKLSAYLLMLFLGFSLILCLIFWQSFN